MVIIREAKVSVRIVCLLTTADVWIDITTGSSFKHERIQVWTTNEKKRMNVIILDRIAENAIMIINIM